jgi:hypothetical protein
MNQKEMGKLQILPEKRKKLYILPNGDAILPEIITIIIADKGCEDKSLLSDSVIIRTINDDIIRIECESYKQAKEIRDKIIFDIDLRDN